MPTVRRYTRSATTAPLPAVRKTAAETAISQGAGVAAEQARSMATLADVGTGVARVGIGMFAQQEELRRREAEKERRRTDTLAVLAGNDELNTWKQSTLYDAQKGLLQRKGADAVNLAPLASAEFEVAASAVLERMSNEDQRVAMLGDISQHRNEVRLTMERHEARERDAYAAQELQSTTANSVDMAIRVGTGDPSMAVPYLRGVEHSLRTVGPTLGLTPAQIDGEVAKVRSQIHVGIIRNLVSDQQLSSARALYAEAKDQIAGDQRDEIQTLLKAGTIQQQAQKETARIFAEGGTLAEQRAKARQIEDPDVQDEVVQRLEHEALIWDREQADAHKTLLRDLYDRLDKGATYSSIPLAERQLLEPNERAGMQAYARARAEGVPIKTDRATYYRWMTMARDKPEQFSKANLMADRYRLDDGDFNQLSSMQVSIAGGSRTRADKDIAAFSSREDVFNETIVQYGRDPKAAPDSEQGKANLRLREMLDRRVEAAQDAGAKVTNTEIRETLHELLGMSAQGAGSIWNLYQPVSKRVIDLTIDDVPKDQKTTIESALRRAGQHVTPERILDLYIRGIERERKER